MKLTRVDKSNSSIEGSTFGVPYPKGQISSGQVKNLRLFANDKQLPSNVFPSAYWPDGTVKWAAVTSVLSETNEFELKPGFENKRKIQVNFTANGIDIENAGCSISIKFKSNNIIDSVVDNSGQQLITKQYLVAETYNKELTIEKIDVEVENVTDTRVVLKSKFTIKSDNDVVMQNTTRVYIYLDSTEFKYVTTNFVDEGALTTTIYNLGIKTECNLEETSNFNKFAKFSLESGSYTEPFLTFASRKYREHNQYYSKQLKGQLIDLASVPEEVKELGATNATWNNFVLKHNNPIAYNLSKSTSKNLQSVKIDEGIKSNGSTAVSNGINDIALIPTNFWEKYPAATEITDLGQDNCSLTFWLNHENEMKFDHYSDKHHFNCYEGFEFIKSSAIGTANTSEFFIAIKPAMSPNEFYKYGEDKQKAHILVAGEQIYRESLAAGIYGKRRGENSKDNYLEQAADEMLGFYNKEIEQRSWYGYWDFGDVMHTFDNHRGQWWYDFGGYAWQNTELNPNMWLWYSFLRNQDMESYKLACNMTRHTSESDVYHFGQYAQLGSRHNVLHYGCSCKEPRISMAHLHRIYYYLHYDERIGEIMDEVVDVDTTMENTGPYDEFYEKVPGKIYMRSGPDWAALCSNWMVKYERSLDIKYLEFIEAGIDSIKNLEHKLLEGPELLYDIKTRKLESIGSGLGNGYHMIISFGAPQVWADYCITFEDDEFAKCLSEFGEHYFRSSSVAEKLYCGKLGKDKFHWPEFAIGVGAFNAYEKNNNQIIHQCKRTLNEFMATDNNLFIKRNIQRHKSLVEYDEISTNRAAQWCLNMFQVLGYEDLINKER